VSCVLRVQSDEIEWESHLSCNGKAIVWNLRNPLRSVLSATVHHMAGLLPMHLSYDDAHGKVSQDWLWSVGCSPLSHTAARLANFSQFHIDSAQRHQVVDILSESIDLANEGIRSLQATHTNLDNLPAAAAVPNDRLVQMHVAVQLSWTKTLQSLHRLDFQNAVPDAHTVPTLPLLAPSRLPRHALCPPPPLHTVWGLRGLASARTGLGSRSGLGLCCVVSLCCVPSRRLSLPLLLMLLLLFLDTKTSSECSCV